MNHMISRPEKDTNRERERERCIDKSLNIAVGENSFLNSFFSMELLIKLAYECRIAMRIVYEHTDTRTLTYIQIYIYIFK